MRSAPPAAAVSRKLPTLADVSPVWRDMTLKLLELETEHEKLLAEAGALAELVVRAGEVVPSRRVSGPQPDPLSPAARAALGSLAPPPPGPIPAPDPTRERALDHGGRAQNAVADLEVRIQGVQQALTVIRERLTRVHAEGSRLLCEAVRDDYAAVASRLCSALVDVANAMQAHDSFVAEVVADGAAPVFLPLLNTVGTRLQSFVGDLRSGDSPLCEVLKSAKEAGYHDPREALATWRAAVPPSYEPLFAEATAAFRTAAADRESIPKVRATTVGPGRGRPLVSSVPAGQGYSVGYGDPDSVHGRVAAAIRTLSPGSAAQPPTPKTIRQRVADAARSLLPAGSAEDSETTQIVTPGAAS